MLTDPETGNSADAVSLGDGTFLMTRIPPGAYLVSFDGYVSATPLQINVASASVSGLNFTVTPAASISGAVVARETGAPYVGVAVSAIDETGNTFFTETDDNGAYAFGSLPAGVYTVQAGGGSATRSRATVGALAVGERRNGANLALNPAARIAGTVNGSGGPLSGAVVSALGADGRGSATATGADGTFTLDGLNAGTYTLVASRDGLVAQELAGISVGGGATASGVNLLLNVVAGRIQGDITQLAGGPPAAFVVLKLTDGTRTFVAQADVQGHYTAADLPAGTYTVTIDDARFMSTSATAAVVAGAATARNVQVAPRGTVSGRVVSTVGGGGVGGVRVFAADGAGEAVADALADANGFYELSGLDAGTYSIVLGDIGSSGIARAAASLSPAAATATVNFSVAATGTVSGTVFLADGVTPDGSAVVALAMNGVPLLSEQVGDDGRYTFVVLQSGTYRVEAADLDGTGVYAPRTVTVGTGAQITGQDFTPGNRAVTVTVRSAANGAPLGSAQVTVTDLAAGLVQTDVGSATSTSAGTFSLGGLRDGSYRIVVQAEGFAAVSQTVSVSGGTPPALNVNLGPEARIRGVVRDGSGTPVAGAVVAIDGAAPGIAGAGLTDENGNYDIGGLPAGTHTLVAIADNFSASKTTVVLAAGATANDLVLATATIQVRGRLTAASSPLGNVTVTAKDASGHVIAETTTASDGTYTLGTLTPGSFTIALRAVGYQPPAAASIAVAAGQTLLGQDFALQAAALSNPPPPAASGSALGVQGKYSTSGVLGFVDVLLRTAEHLPREPKLTDLDGKINMEHCKDESLKAIQLVSQIPSLFDDWAQAQSRMRWSTGRELVSLGLQTADLVGKIYSLFAGEALSVAKSGASAATRYIIDYVAPLAQSIVKILVAVRFNQSEQSFSDKFLDILASLNEAASKALDLKSALNTAKGLVTSSTLTVAGEILKELDIAIALTQELQEVADAYRSLLDQVASVFNAKNRYSQAVAEANAAIYFLDLCRGSERGEPVPPLPPGRSNGGSSATNVGGSHDPNDLIGPAGFGSQRQLLPGTFPYRVEFENDAAFATAAAQIVTITLALDTDFDPSTFQFTGLGFGSRNYTVPAGLSQYDTTLDLRPTGTNLLVPVALDLNPVVGSPGTYRVEVSFASLDPLTRRAPDGVNDGFLPVDNAAGDGEGYFTFTVRPKAGLATGTAVTAQASIVFDTNAAIATPTVLNTIDVAPPTSSVSALAATQSSTTFTVNWSGTDAGSGVAFYDVYVSDNAGPFTPFRTATTATSAAFTGVAGHTYAFYSVATDNVGLVQPTPPAAQATTSVDVPPPPPVVRPELVGFPAFAVGADSGLGAAVQFYGATAADDFKLPAFGGFAGGVRTTAADFTGDGLSDLAVGTGVGAVAEVVVYDGATRREVFRVRPFADFTGGVFVTGGDVTGDGAADLVVTPDQGGGPRVTVFRGGSFAVAADFFGIEDPNFRGGARAALGDVNADGVADLVVSAGLGGGPRIAIFDGRALGQSGQITHLVNDFFTFEDTLRNGAYVAAGDLDGDGYADVIGGGGPGGGPRVLVLGGKELVTQRGDTPVLANFFAGNIDNRGGIRVAAKNLDDDRFADLVVGDGVGGGSRVTGYFGTDFVGGVAPEGFSFDAYPGFTGGVFVG
ncbi:MAG: carboxypeptidase regulatory-like domain-containing protein [Gemmataceae bacterium]|nr:carboxypeptidase regulatory-like domain-containing protein [Gemmataceae bacterium]